MAQGVMAIRIYYDEITMTPWADLKMADGVIEVFGTPKEVFDHPKSEKTKNFLSNSLEKF